MSNYYSTNALFINFGGIGDEILFLPTLKSFKLQFPNSKITLALEPRSQSIKELSHFIDDLFLINIKSVNKYAELLKLVFLARKNKFDIIVSSGANKFIPILLFLTGAKIRIAYDNGCLSKKLLTIAVPLNKNQYAANMYHDLIKPLLDSNLITNEQLSPEIFIDNDINIEKNSVLIHPGVSKLSLSKNMIKTYSPQKWVELIKKLLQKGKLVYIVGGPDDESCINEIEKILSETIINNKDNFKNLYGSTKNIKDLARLIKSKEFLICCDSAPMHVGVSVNAKILAIFGATDEKKLLPNNKNFIAIKNQTPCRPCLFDVRQSTCQKLDCLEINPDEFLKYI